VKEAASVKLGVKFGVKFGVIGVKEAERREEQAHL
jgi:hypothetical protein